MKYSEMLKDPRWQKKRLQVFERDNWKCTECGNTDKTLHAHHNKYDKKPWKTKLKHIVTLCEECHTFIHQAEKETIKVKAIRHGREGFIPANFNDCPRFKEDGTETSCCSSSGDSFCLGWFGANEEKMAVNCWWNQ